MQSPLNDLLHRLDGLSEQFRDFREGVHRAICIVAEDPKVALARARGGRRGRAPRGPET